MTIDELIALLKNCPGHDIGHDVDIEDCETHGEIAAYWAGTRNGFQCAAQIVERDRSKLETGRGVLKFRIFKEDNAACRCGKCQEYFYSYSYELLDKDGNPTEYWPDPVDIDTTVWSREGMEEQLSDYAQSLNLAAEFVEADNG